MHVNKKPPKVSVCIVTYNQEKYIAQCLKSIVNQQTDFDFEIIISDDCSTDNTKKIITDFSKKYPKIIKPIFHKKNFGDSGLSNYKYVHRQAKGEYVAHIDGDDLMLPLKLLKQKRYLDEHTNCPLVAHRMEIWRNGCQVGVTKDSNSYITLTELLIQHPIFLHSSIMYRSTMINNIYYTAQNFIDYYLYVAAAKKGDIGFIDDALGRYESGIGISSNLNLMPFIQSAIDLAKKSAPDHIISLARSKQYLSYAGIALLTNHNQQFIENITLAKEYDKKSKIINLLYFFKKNPNFLKRIVLFHFKIKNYTLKKNYALKKNLRAPTR